jgi:hypothetical protein
MSQVKIHGHAAPLRARREAISRAIQSALTSAIGLPAEKCFQRFFPLDDVDFIHPTDRSENYTILEISMFQGRSVESRKALIRQLFANFQEIGIASSDLEITIFETPRENWGIRGVPGDELQLGYQVKV